MASPFRVFRKHEKMLLVVLGIAAMFAFVVFDPLVRFVSHGNGETQNPVVASWDGRTVHRRELDAIVHIRKISSSFLSVAAREGMVVTGQQPPVPILVRVSEDRSAQRILALRTMMLADMASRAGIDVSEKTVNTYLGYLTQNSVDPRQLTALFHRAFGQSGVTEAMMFNLLREELLGVEYLRSYQLSAATTLPSTRWELWKKLNDRISLNLVTLPVKDFVAKVTEPTEDEVKEFYDKYRSDEKQPAMVGNTELPSPRPGFKVPRMVTLEYLKADFDDFVERMAKDISDDEVAQYYEDHKDEYKRVELEGESSPTGEPASETNDQPPAGAALNEPANNEPADKEPIEESKQPPVESSASEPQDQTEPAEENTENKQPDKAAASDASNPPSDEDTSDKSSNKSPDDEEPGESNLPPGGRSSSLTSRTARLRLVAYQDDSQKSADTPRSKDAGQTEEKTVSDTPLDNGSPPPAPEPDRTATSPPTASADQYQPLSEVADEIRRRLAEQRAAAHIEEILATPLRKMRLYAEDRSAAEATAKSEKESDKPKLPEPPALEALAKDTSLTYEKTAPLSYFDLRETDVGKSGNSEYPYTLAAKVFTENEQGRLRMYQPGVTMDGMTGDRYLVWKIKDEAAHEVPLDEIRDQVVAAWKMEKSVELARKEAKRLADEATQKGGSLEQIFGKDAKHPVTKTDMFSWLTTGATTPEGPVSLRLSNVTGVDSAGPEFMDSVFALKPDEVTVATNYPQTKVYVVQLADREKTPSELHEEFMGSADPRDILNRSLYGALSQQSIEATQSLVFRQVQETLNVEINLPSPSEEQ